MNPKLPITAISFHFGISREKASSKLSVVPSNFRLSRSSHKNIVVVPSCSDASI